VKNGGKWWISCSLPIASSLERTRWTQSSRCVDQHGLWSIEVNDMYFSGWPSFMVRSFFCGWLVVFRLPLWKMMDLVSRDDEIPNIWKKNHVPNHQLGEKMTNDVGLQVSCCIDKCKSSWQFSTATPVLAWHPYKVARAPSRNWCIIACHVFLIVTMMIHENVITVYIVGC
jgi:hypothetical protein